MYNWRLIDEDHLPPGNPAGQLIHPLGWCNCLNITSIKKVSVHKNSCSSDRALKSGSKLEFGWRKSLDNKALEWRTLKFVQVPIHYYISVKMHCVIGRSWQSLKGLFLPATHPSLASTLSCLFLTFWKHFSLPGAKMWPLCKRRIYSMAKNNCAGPLFHQIALHLYS